MPRGSNEHSDEDSRVAPHHVQPSEQPEVALHELKGALAILAL